MHLRLMRELVYFCALPAFLSAQLYARDKLCFSADQASRLVNKDVCITAHVYDVVQLADGTRFLDTCAPDVPDDLCRFTIISAWADHEEVGQLVKYRDADVHIRGILQPMHGRLGMVLSHSRQFSGGPPKFRANPRLLRGFSGDQDRPPVNDPNLRSQGSPRGFMNNKNRQPLPTK